MHKRNVVKELTNEKLELDKRIDSLGEALKNKAKFSISDSQFELLRRQFNAMDAYSRILYERICDLQEAMPPSRITSGTINADKAASASLAQKVIDSAKTKTENMSFGEALEALKQGNCVARKGWNGKGIFIKLKKGEPLNTPNNRFDEVMTHDFIYIDTTGLQTSNRNAPKDRVPWLASQTDMLADDWQKA